MRACYAAKNPKWNCKKWAKKTLNIKGLPEKLWRRKQKAKKKKK
jgi:hypothetical protein